jgi:P27 family predicted phage terminase small subunit
LGSRGPIPDPNSGRSKAGRNTRTKKPAPARPADAAPTAGKLPAPPDVAAVPAALGFWQAVAPSLIDAGRLAPEQTAAFAILCQIHADILAHQEQLAAEGWITATDKGQAASPVAKLLRDSRRDFVMLARDFGLTASSAARLPQDPTDGEADDEEDRALRAFTGG